MWIADVYRPSNLTGGASVVDIIVSPVPYGNAVYVGGLGDAFCKISAQSGDKVWCVEISVSMPFMVAGNYAFVVADDNNLYAIRLADGVIFWRAHVDERAVPVYADGVIAVGADKIDVATGKKI